MPHHALQTIFYASSQVGVMFDRIQHEQVLLQGHKNAITSTCVSGNRLWVATADTGSDNSIIVWDVNTHVPVRTFFSDEVCVNFCVWSKPDSHYHADTWWSGGYCPFARCNVPRYSKRGIPSARLDLGLDARYQHGTDDAVRTGLHCEAPGQAIINS